MKITLTLCTLLYTTFLFSQDTTRWKIGVHFSPDLCYRILSLNGSDDAKFILEHRNHLETRKFGFTTGVSGLWQFSSHFELSAGILYSNKGYRTKKMSLDPIIEGTSIRTQYNYHCIDIPIGINYIAGKKRLKFIGTIALTTNVFLTEIGKSYQYYGSEKPQKKSGKTNDEYRPIWLTGEVGAGVSYDLNDRYSIRLIPCFRYGLTRINDTPIVGRLWSAGVNVGGYFHF